MKRILAIALGATLAVACSKKKEEPAPMPPPAGSAMDPGSAAAAGSGSQMLGSATVVAPPDQTGMAPGSGSAGSAAGSDAVDVPTETDFEAAADKDITEKNIEAQLSAIEKELGK